MISIWQLLILIGVLIVPTATYIRMLQTNSRVRVYCLYRHPVHGDRIASNRPRALAFFFADIWPLLYLRFKMWIAVLLASICIFGVAAAAGYAFFFSAVIDTASDRDAQAATATAVGALVGLVAKMSIVGWYVSRRAPVVIQDRLALAGYELIESGRFANKDAALASWFGERASRG